MPPPPIPDAGLDALGGFFSLSTKDDGTGWRRGDELLTDLDDAVEDYLGRLRTDRVDIAGSLLVQGWAARLTAVFMGSTALTGAAPNLAADALDIRLPPRGTLQLALRTSTMLDTDEAWRHLCDGHLSPLVEAVHTLCRSGRRRLWGNVAAVAAGAVITLRHNGNILSSPEPAELTGLGNYLSPFIYARRTCCGLVRVPGRSACGDCVLRWRRS